MLIEEWRRNILNKTRLYYQAWAQSPSQSWWPTALYEYRLLLVNNDHRTFALLFKQFFSQQNCNFTNTFTAIYNTKKLNSDKRKLVLICTQEVSTHNTGQGWCLFSTEVQKKARTRVIDSDLSRWYNSVAGGDYLVTRRILLYRCWFLVVYHLSSPTIWTVDRKILFQRQRLLDNG